MMEKIFYRIWIMSILTIILGLTSCSGYSGYEDCHNTITLKNNASTSIYYVTTLKEGFLNYDPTNPTYAADYKVAADASKNVKIGISLSCWEQTLKSAEGYLYLYIYDAALLESTTWAEAKTKFIKKYTLNADQLNKMKWTVAYP